MPQLTFQIRGYCEVQVRRASEVTQLAAREPEFTRDQSSQNQWCQPLVASIVIAFIILSVCVPGTVHNIPDSYNSPSGWLDSRYFAGEEGQRGVLTCPNPKSITELGIWGESCLPSLSSSHSAQPRKEFLRKVVLPWEQKQKSVSCTFVIDL